MDSSLRNRFKEKYKYLKYCATVDRFYTKLIVKQFFVDFAAPDDKLIILRKIYEKFSWRVLRKKFELQAKNPSKIPTEGEKSKGSSSFWSFFSSCMSF